MRGNPSVMGPSGGGGGPAAGVPGNGGASADHRQRHEPQGPRHLRCVRGEAGAGLSSFSVSLHPASAAFQAAVITQQMCCTCLLSNGSSFGVQDFDGWPQVGGERYNLFTGCPEARTATFVLRGGSEQVRRLSLICSSIAGSCTRFLMLTNTLQE